MSKDSLVHAPTEATRGASETMLYIPDSNTSKAIKSVEVVITFGWLTKAERGGNVVSES